MAHPSKVKGNTYEREIVAKFEESGIECISSNLLMD